MKCLKNGIMGNLPVIHSFGEDVTENPTLQARHSPIMSPLHLEIGDAVGDARSTVLAQGHQREESASVQEAKANNPSSRNQRSLQSEYV
jgi:hypothetical protein